MSVSQAVAAHQEYLSLQSEDTAVQYNRHVENWIDYLDGRDVGVWEAHSGHAESFYRYLLDDGYAPETVRKAHAALSSFYGKVDDFAGTRGFPSVTFERDPTENASPERLDGMHGASRKRVEGGDDPLSRDEIQQLVDNVPPDKPVRNELIIRLLYQTGVRRGELVNIKLHHIDRDDRRIQIYGEKTEDSRPVWYRASLNTLLDLWIEGDRDAVYYAEESDYLFPSRRSVNISGQTVTDVVTEAAERAGIQEEVYETRGGGTVHRITPHMLRKSHGVHYLDDGGDVTFLMKLLGHADIETTVEHYLTYSDKEVGRSARRHGPSL